MVKTTILVETFTRDRLKQLGTKGQTYDWIINGLINTTRKEGTGDLA
jgi:hypothetical protein